MEDVSRDDLSDSFGEMSAVFFQAPSEIYNIEMGRLRIKEKQAVIPFRETLASSPRIVDIATGFGISLHIVARNARGSASPSAMFAG